MTKSYQLVAWTDKGQVRMIPSEVSDYIQTELEAIGRFFAMFCVCKDLVRQYPRLRYAWDRSDLQRSCNFINYPFDCFENEWNSCAGDPDEAMAYNKALNFGKNEVFRRRRY